MVSESGMLGYGKKASGRFAPATKGSIITRYKAGRLRVQLLIGIDGWDLGLESLSTDNVIKSPVPHFKQPLLLR